MRTYHWQKVSRVRHLSETLPTVAKRLWAVGHCVPLKVLEGYQWQNWSQLTCWQSVWQSLQITQRILTYKNETFFQSCNLQFWAGKLRTISVSFWAMYHDNLSIHLCYRIRWNTSQILGFWGPWRLTQVSWSHTWGERWPVTYISALGTTPYLCQRC